MNISLIVIKGGKLKTYHEFKDINSLLKHLEHHIRNEKTVSVVVYQEGGENAGSSAVSE